MKPIIIEYASKLYPKMLRSIEKPPSRLYVLGNIEVLNDIGIAVVGSRTNTEYGEKMCKKFVKGLLEYNINIISGLAFGIDSIKNDGAIISEYENDIEADSNKFLERNRIVAGLGIGTLVVEAGYRSGTSVTARFTQQDEKPVFCVPSSLENMKGILTNELIQKGAKLVRNAEDIIKEIKKINPEVLFYKKEIKTRDLYFDISPELLNVYKAITCNPMDLNQIARRTGLSISEVNYKTMMLQLEDKIVELPGQRFIRNNN